MKTTTPFRCLSPARFATLSLFLATILLQGGARLAAAEEGTCAKKLVVVAGPRRSATTSVAEFFYKYARGPQPNRKSGNLYHPLQKIRWPLVYGPESNKTETPRPYKRFNHLVTQSKNTKLYAEIIDAIKRDWELEDVDTIIFGGEEFDQVGAAAANPGMAIKAVKDVQTAVGAPSECVTILFNYREPRFQHWVSLYGSKSRLESGENEEDKQYIPYEKHMCLDESSKTRIMELGTTMNPMYLAETYLKADPGWKVTMIDMGGVASFGSDISHTVGCDVLGAKCDDDKIWVKGHVEETINNKVLVMDYNDLPAIEVVDSEQIFRFRDCAYQNDLTTNYNGRFSILHQEGMWDDCHGDDEWMQKIYNSLRQPGTGTRLVYDALLSQVDCTEFGTKAATPSNNIYEILDGHHLDGDGNDEDGEAEEDIFEEDFPEEEFDEAEGMTEEEFQEDIENLGLDNEEFYPEDAKSFREYAKSLRWDDPVAQAGAGGFLTLLLCCCGCWCGVMYRRRALYGGPRPISIPRIELKNFGQGSSNGGRRPVGRGPVRRSNGASYRDQLRSAYDSDDDDSSSDDDSSDGRDTFRDERGSSSSGKSGGFLSRFGKKKTETVRPSGGGVGDFI